MRRVTDGHRPCWSGHVLVQAPEATGPSSPRARGRRPPSALGDHRRRGQPGRPQDSGSEQPRSRRSRRSAFWVGSVGPAGWDRSHLLLLTDFGGSDDPGTVQSPAPNITPTKKNLDWAFREWLAPRAKPGDVIVFYFAGQSRSVASAGPLRPSPEYYLLPTDVHLREPAVPGLVARQGTRWYTPSKGSIKSSAGWATAIRPEPAAAREKVSAHRQRRTQPRLASPPRALAGRDRLAGVRRTLPSASRADPAVPFTQALLAGLGKGDHKHNLTGCLRSLAANLAISRDFDRSAVFLRSLSLWAGQLGQPARSPQPEMVLAGWARRPDPRPGLHRRRPAA